MHKHCKGCKHHWKHGKPDTKFADWCTKYGTYATRTVGHCKLNNGKEV